MTLASMLVAAMMLSGDPSIDQSVPAFSLPTPASQQCYESHTVALEATFNVGINPSTVAVHLNGYDVTESLTVSAARIFGELEAKDGLVIGDESCGSFFAPNVLIVTGREWITNQNRTTFRVFYTTVPAEPAVQSIVGTGGGQLELSGVATLTVPPGAFSEPTLVRVAHSTNELASGLASEYGDFYNMSGPGSRQVVVTMPTQPLLPLSLELTVPAETLAAATPQDELFAFYVNSWEEDGEFEQTIRPCIERGVFTASELRVSVPEWAFSPWTEPNQFQAIVFAALMPTALSVPQPVRLARNQGPHSSNRQELHRPWPNQAWPVGVNEPEIYFPLGQQDGTCQGSSLDQPWTGDHPIRDEHGVRIHPVTGERSFHDGIDVAMPEGTDILAAASGRIRYKIDSGDTSLRTGFGYYAVIEHADGSATLYGHLTANSGTVPSGQSVTAGQVLGKSGNTGRSTGPHLHFTYAPNGRVFHDPSTVDPVPCFGGLVEGGVIVRDNGNLADDAFRVSINGAPICETTVGGQNNCSASNLRPGQAILRIDCLIAPDDVGTYEIILTQGITFAAGGTRTSGTLSMGGFATFTIVIPEPN